MDYNYYNYNLVGLFYTIQSGCGSKQFIVLQLEVCLIIHTPAIEGFVQCIFVRPHKAYFYTFYCFVKLPGFERFRFGFVKLPLWLPYLRRAGAAVTALAGRLVSDSTIVARVLA